MTQALGQRTRNYIAAQTAIGTLKVHTGTDAVKLLEAINVRRMIETVNRDDFTPSIRSPNAVITGATTCEVDIPDCYLLGAGTQGNAPDLTAAYKTAFTETTTVATTVMASPTPSTTTFKLTADNLDAGQIGWIETDDGENVHFYVVSKDESDVLTIWPPLTAAPTALDNVKACVNYNLAQSNTAFCTCHTSDNATGQIASGVKFGQLTFSFEKGQPGKVTASGIGKTGALSIHTTLDGAINDSVTAVSVAAEGITEGAVLYCGTEKLYVSAVATNGVDLTVTRGYDSSSAAAHDSGAAIGPYEPTETTAGNAIRGLHGGLKLEDRSGGAMLLKTDSVTVTYNSNDEPQNYFGDGGEIADILQPANREVSISAEVHLDANAQNWLANIENKTGVKACIQAGNAAGRACFFYFPSVIFSTPEVPRTKNEVVKVTLESVAVLSTSGENAMSFAF